MGTGRSDPADDCTGSGGTGAEEGGGFLKMMAATTPAATTTAAPNRSAGQRRRDCVTCAEGAARSTTSRVAAVLEAMVGGTTMSLAPKGPRNPAMRRSMSPWNEACRT